MSDSRKPNAGPTGHTGGNTVEQNQASHCVQMTTGLQGLMSQMEKELEKKMRKVCKTAKMYEDAAEKSMMMTTNIYNDNRRILVNKHVSELKFAEQAKELFTNVTLLRKRSTSLSQQLKKLQRNVQEQIKELYRSEVDIDMKLRACRGSCRSALPFSVDHPSYQTLQAQMNQMDMTANQIRKSAKPSHDIPHIKLQPVDVGAYNNVGEYKTIPVVQRELLTQFEDLGQNQVLLEELLEESSDLDNLNLAEQKSDFENLDFAGPKLPDVKKVDLVEPKSSDVKKVDLVEPKSSDVKKVDLVEPKSSDVENLDLAEPESDYEYLDLVALGIF